MSEKIIMNGYWAVNKINRSFTQEKEILFSFYCDNGEWDRTTLDLIGLALEAQMVFLFVLVRNNISEFFFSLMHLLTT